MSTDLYISFGQKYFREEHPTFPKCDPNGWLRITADTYPQARAVAFALLDGQFAFEYLEDEFEVSKDFFPAGELHHIDVRLNREE
jgi:hypothetical protein